MTTLAYHGTSSASATTILSNRVDVSLGGGEIGQGFYLAERRYVSEIWAKQRHQHSPAVVEFELPDSLVFSEQNANLDLHTTTQLRHRIRELTATRTYRIGCDLAVAPIVGTTRGSILGQIQLKVESASAEGVVNAPSTVKRSV
jgi:hypothetical protein